MMAVAFLAPWPAHSYSSSYCHTRPKNKSRVEFCKWPLRTDRPLNYWGQNDEGWRQWTEGVGQGLMYKEPSSATFMYDREWKRYDRESTSEEMSEAPSETDCW